MRFYVGNTDKRWFDYLKSLNPEDVNFWQPKGNSNFKILDQFGAFLFRLKAPVNKIAGVGFFSSQSFFPINVAWDVFGVRNGCASFAEFKSLILSYRDDKLNSNPTIGCIVLTSPIFFEKEDWLDVEPYWSKSGIVQGKSFSDTTMEGRRLWLQVEQRITKYSPPLLADKQIDLQFETSAWKGYGNSILQKVRLGQGAFRVLVTDAYSRKCSISGEKTLPVLEAAHIKPYNLEGPHSVSNGLLLRSDLHKLFDSGYITITKD